MRHIRVTEGVVSNRDGWKVFVLTQGEIDRLVHREIKAALSQRSVLLPQPYIERRREQYRRSTEKRKARYRQLAEHFGERLCWTNWHEHLTVLDQRAKAAS